jgi:Fe2+ transport system protein B
LNSKTKEQFIKELIEIYKNNFSFKKHFKEENHLKFPGIINTVLKDNQEIDFLEDVFFYTKDKEETEYIVLYLKYIPQLSSNMNSIKIKNQNKPNTVNSNLLIDKIKERNNTKENIKNLEIIEDNYEEETKKFKIENKQNVEDIEEEIFTENKKKKKSKSPSY